MGILGFARLLQRNVVTNDTRGAFGEMVVNSIFDNRVFGDEEHYIVNNLIFKVSNETTHQIDHVVIYKTGIFCIETKNIQGLINGTNTGKYWKRFYKNRSWSFYNPVLQNYKHVTVLRSFLTNKYVVNSLIVFIKGNKPKGVSEEVVNIQELKDYVKNFSAKEELSSDEMQNIYNLLISYKQNCKLTNNEHINSIKDNKK